MSESDNSSYQQKSSYAREDLLACAHGTLFPTPLPKLPLPPMLMVDRITQISSDGGSHGKGELIAEFDIKPDLWFFACHFEGDPVMPGCLGLDALWQLTGFFLGWSGASGSGRALGLGELKFTEQILPTTKLVTYKLDFKRVINRRLVLGIADGQVLADGKVIYEATDLKVGLFDNN